MRRWSWDDVLQSLAPGILSPVLEPDSIDDLLAELVHLSERLGEDDLTPGERVHLEERRSYLRNLARRVDDTSRSRAVLENELGSLRRRLAEIDDRPIGKGWTEKTNTRWLNDPGAYSSQINRIIDDQDRDERAEVVERIGEIEAALGDGVRD
jgi:hypothetical protein